MPSGRPLYRALTGGPPADIGARISGTPITPPSALGIEIPPRAERALMKALALRPEKRIKDVATFLRELTAYAPEHLRVVRPKRDISAVIVNRSAAAIAWARRQRPRLDAWKPGLLWLTGLGIGLLMVRLGLDLPPAAGLALLVATLIAGLAFALLAEPLLVEPSKRRQASGSEASNLD